MQVGWAEQQHVLQRTKRSAVDMPKDPMFAHQWYLVSLVLIAVCAVADAIKNNSVQEYIKKALLGCVRPQYVTSVLLLQNTKGLCC